MTSTSGRQWSEPLVRRLIDENGSADDPQEIIEDYADQLRRDAGQDAFPIQVDLISSLKGIRRRSAQHGFAGRIYAEESGQLVLDINSADSPARQAFTEAHELIHTAFPGFTEEKRYRSDASSDVRNPPNREEEYLCDFGAASLLMPRNLVEGRYSVARGLSDAERLADEAQVSIEAAANRLISLADEPAILICFRVAHKPADGAALRRGEAVEQKLRVSYASSRHLNTYVPRFKAADGQSSAVRSLLSGRIESGVERLPGAGGGGLYRTQAKCYGAGALERVLAIGRPTA